MPITQSVSFNADIPIRGEAPEVFSTKANGAWVELERVFDEDLYNFSTQANALEANINAMEASTISAANSAAESALIAKSAANFQGVWTPKGYSYGQSTKGSDGVIYQCDVTHTVAQNPTSTTGYWSVNVPLGAVGNIMSPVVELDFRTSLKVKTGVGSITFNRASSGYAPNKYNKMVSYATNEPRFGKYGVVIEGAVTNNFLHAKDFSQSAWVKNNVTPTYDVEGVVDMFGTNTATKILEVATTSTKIIYQNIAVTLGVSKTVSFAILPTQGRSEFQIDGHHSYVGNSYVNFNLSTMVITNIGNAIGIIEKVGAWYVISATFTPIITGTAVMALVSIKDGTHSYLGEEDKGYYIQYGQSSDTPTPGKFVDTTTAPATKAQDDMFIQFEGNAGLGTDSSTTIIEFYAPSFNGMVGRLYEDNSMNYVMSLVNGNIAQSHYETDGIIGGTLVNGTLNTIAHVLDLVDGVGTETMYLNGAFVASKAVSAPSSIFSVIGALIGFGGYGSLDKFYGELISYKRYDKALTPTEVALA